MAGRTEQRRRQPHALPARTPAGTATNADGFTLVGLMVVVAVINIGLGVAVTSWAIIDKRAREAELIWRGQQYVRALRCHQQREGGYPDALDELLESDCIRALYSDPMAPGGEWRIIRESDLRIGAGAGGAGGAEGILDDLQREVGAPGGAPDDSLFDGSLFDDAAFPAALGRAGRGAFGGRGAAGQTEARGSASTTDTTSLQAAYQRLRDLTDRLQQDFGGNRGNGIVGVVSRSTDQALRMYEGETTYDAWRFVAR